MQIKVSNPSDLEASYEVMPEQTVLELREQICKTEGLTLSQFYLCYYEDTLNDEDTMEDCGIQENSKLVYALRCSNRSTIEARIDGCEPVKLDYRLTDTIQKLKRIIGERAFGRRFPLVVIYQGKILENLMTVRDCGIEENAVLYVTKA